MMYYIDPSGLVARGGVGRKKSAKEKGNFTSLRTNWVHALDGHDKLMGYQNSTFPLAIYGCMDTASRKLLWLRVWMSNHDPQLIGRWYLEYLMESLFIPSMIIGNQSMGININQLQKLQYRAARIITSSSFDTPKQTTYRPAGMEDH